MWRSHASLGVAVIIGRSPASFAEGKHHSKNALLSTDKGAFLLEAPPGFEPGDRAFAELCLTAWLWRRIYWSGKRDSNSRHLPWQGNALPLSHSRRFFLRCIGGNNRARTYDPLLVRQMLSQLSYAPTTALIYYTKLRRNLQVFLHSFFIFPLFYFAAP